MAVHSMYRRIVSTIERPRRFAQSHGYFGPDRHRTEDSNHGSPERRVQCNDEYETRTGEPRLLCRRAKPPASSGSRSATSRMARIQALLFEQQHRLVLKTTAVRGRSGLSEVVRILSTLSLFRISNSISDRRGPVRLGSRVCPGRPDSARPAAGRSPTSAEMSVAS